MKTTTLILLGLSTALFCSCSRYTYTILTLETPNPTCYEYDFPKDSIKVAMDYWFGRDNKERKKRKVRGLSSGYAYYDSNSFYRSRYKVFKEDSLLNMIFLMNSTIYINTKTEEGLTYYPVFCIHVDSLSAHKTRVCVLTPDSKVVIGYKFGPHSTGAYRPMELSVPPSTIEEYKILQVIGDRLGVKNMPPINYPKALTEKQIKQFKEDWYQ